MENATYKNDDITVLRIIADKSKNNKFLHIFNITTSLIIELLFYILFGVIIAIELLPLDSLIWKEFAISESNVSPEQSDLILHAIVIVKVILGCIGIVFLSLGILLRKLRTRDTTIAEINKLAEQALKVPLIPKPASGN